MTTHSQKKIIRYRFISYFKHCFTVYGDDGYFYILDDEYCNAGDTYRFGIEDSGVAEVVSEGILIDQLLFKRK